MYLKSTYLDGKGDVRLVRYMDSEQGTKDFFGNIFDEMLDKKILKKGELMEALDIAMYDLPDTKNLLKYYKEFIEALAGDYVETKEDIQTYERTGLSPEIRYANLSTETGLKLDLLTDKNIQQELKNSYTSSMYKKSLENEYYDSLEKLITLPENFDRLISPIDDAGLKALSGKLDKLRGYDETTIKNRILDRNYMTTLRNSFVTAKRWVGIAAVNITNLSLKQKSEVYIDTARFAKLPLRDQEVLGDGSIALKHNTVLVNGVEKVSLSGTTVKDSDELISNRLSGYATSFVDVAKDDYITKIIQSDLIIGTFMFLENIGAGEQSAMFLNQPIISEYLKLLDSDNVKNLFNLKKIATIKNKFITTKDTLADTSLNIANLDRNIQRYYIEGDLNSIENAEQHHILDEFLKYAKMAQFNFKFTQATNYDTTKLRSAETLSKKQWRTETAADTNIISSVKNILNSTFIGPQSKFLDKSTEAMGAVLKLDQLDFKEITNTVLRTFGNNEYLSNDKFEKIAVEIKASFIDYAVQLNSGVNDKIKRLLIDDDTSVAFRLEKAKIAYPNMQILKELEVATGDIQDSVKTIKLRVRPDNAADKNMYTGMMRELRDNPATNQLYKDIVDLSILQGTFASPLSIREIIPIEDYSNIVEPIISGLVINDDLNNFTKGWYQRNNFKNADAFPTISVKFLVQYGQEPIHTPEGDIYQYYSPSFEDLEGLGVKANDRKILILNDKYNEMYLDYDYVKIPRVTGGIDMTNGKEVWPSDYAKRKAKGDYTLNDYFGYQKVRDDFGYPLVNYKLVKGELIGYHIYKLINLYGDGDRATENYDVFKPSVIGNGTIKINTEIPNKDIINYYGASLEKEDVSLPAIEAPKVEQEYTPFEEIQPTVNEPEKVKKELFTFDKAIEQKSFRKKELNFVDNIPTAKDSIVAMRNNKKTGVISIDQKAMIQKFEDKAWTKPSKQLDGSFAEPLAEDEFKSPEEFFTFALLHEVKHDTIFKEEGYTTGEYEDIINDAALADLRENYNIPAVKEFIDPNQLNLFDEDTWKEEDNDDTCAPF